MERLAKNIESNAENFDDEDWEAVLNEFKALQEEALSCEFTHEQYIELGRVEGKLSSTLTSERAKSHGRDFKELLENGKNFINGFMDGINKE